MPKVIPYRKGSIIFFEGDKDERIYILQSGAVLLTQRDLDSESGNSITEQLAVGEFFGVKNALAHKPRLETATAGTDVTVVQLTVPEFEKVIGPNQTVIMKMLRVFSRDLRDIHHKTEFILNTQPLVIPADEGMLKVANSYFQEENFHSCIEVCNRLLARFPNTTNASAVKKLKSSAELEEARNKKARSRFEAMAENAKSNDNDENAALKQFSLPMFERFSKTYSDGDVIICEHEPGDCFYLIQSGTVQLQKCVNNSAKNLDILRPGEFFGEMAIMDNAPRSATCLAKGSVKCLEFNKDNFKILVTGNPQIAIILLKLFCKRIYDQRRRFSILMIKELPVRIADVFLLYDEMQGNTSTENPKRTFYLTVNDVAHWAGITLEEARSEVDKMSKRGRIQVFDDRMIVNNIVDMQRSVSTYYSMSSVKK